MRDVPYKIGRIEDARLTILSIEKEGLLLDRTTYRVRFDCCQSKEQIVTHKTIKRRKIRKPKLCGVCVKSDPGRIERAVASRKRTMAAQGRKIGKRLSDDMRADAEARRPYGIIPPPWPVPRRVKVER